MFCVCVFSGVSNTTHGKDRERERESGYLFDLLQLCDPLACASRSSRRSRVVVAAVLVFVFVFVLIDVHFPDWGAESERGSSGVSEIESGMGS